MAALWISICGGTKILGRFLSTCWYDYIKIDGLNSAGNSHFVVVYDFKTGSAVCQAGFQVTPNRLMARHRKRTCLFTHKT